MATLTSVRRTVRSGFDRFLAALMLSLLSPVVLLLTVLVRALDGRPVLFRQVRIGLRAKPFTMIKFRTMRVDSNPYMRKPDDHDPVVTPLGRLLRGRALDELPQLWNVVRGEMALVGPRPEMPFVVDEYGPLERRRLEAKPGLTGLWQLSRVRDRAIEHHVEYDLFYVANRSFGMDFWLLWRTAVFALTGRATKIRLAVARWERDTTWRRLVPDRSRAIPKRTRRRLSVAWGMAAVAGFTFLVLPSGVMALLARGDLMKARGDLLAAKTSLRSVDVAAARAALDRADESLRRGEEKLTSWVTAPGRFVPGVSGNLSVATALAASGRQLVAAGKEGLPVIAALPLAGNKLVPPLANGTLDLVPFQKATASAVQIQERVARAEHILRASSGSLILPQVARTRDEALRLLSEARRQADVASGAAFLVPRVFGAEGKRTWLIGAENTAELRGRGGYIGALGTVETDGGHIELGTFFDTADLPRPLPAGTPADTPEEFVAHYKQLGGLQAWQNLGMSPNFPSTGSVLLSRLAASKGGVKASGIISVDPTALSYLLDVTGPVQVEGVPEQLTAANVVDWTLNRLYFEYQKDNEERKGVLAGVAQAVWTRLVDGHDIDPARLADAVSRAIAERHLVVYSSDPEEQALIERLGMGGEVSRAAGDYLLVLGQNMGENKMDFYLKRSVKYRGTVAVDGSIDARLEITVTNTAPSGPLPSYVAGPRDHLGLELGVARTYLNAFVPAEATLQDAVVDGEFPKDVENRLELGRRFFGVTLDLRPGQERKVVFRYTVPDVLVDGRYGLTIQNQSTVHPDDVSVEVRVPATSTGDRDGFSRAGTLAWVGSAQADTSLTADFDPSLPARLATHLFGFLRKPFVAFAG